MWQFGGSKGFAIFIWARGSDGFCGSVVEKFEKVV